jgi:hypothetical protein
MFIVSYQAKHEEHRVRFEVFMAVTMKNAVFWDVAHIPENGILHEEHYLNTSCIVSGNLVSHNVLENINVKTE